MTTLRVLVFNLYFYTFTLVVALLLYLLAKLSTRAAMHRVLRAWGQGVLGGLRRILGSRIEIRGLERLPPEGPRLVVSKHQSELDIIVIAALFPQASAVAMAELRRYPFFGPILEKLGVVLVAVEAGPQGRTQQVIDGARRVVAEGRPMYIFPEGELMALGARERYRKGAAHIYTALDVAAFPVAASLGAVWPQRRWRKRVGRTGAIEFLEPIAPGLPFDAFLAEVESRIETQTMALIREHAVGADLSAAEDRFARGVNNHGDRVPTARPSTDAAPDNGLLRDDPATSSGS
ncbi:MAG: lysophospholipid acyltransferase family protein [Pikeienuella sp.]